MAKLSHLTKGFIKLCVNKFLKRRFPLNVFIAVTNQCNLKCDYCYGEYYKRKDMREFTTDELIKLLYDLKKNGALLLQIQGGEPLMRRDIGTIIKTAKSLKLNTDLITNGLLVPSKIEDIKMLDSICISIDGRKKINDKNRGRNTFEHIINAIDICKKNKIATRLNCIITNETEEEDIIFLMEFCKEKKTLANFCPTFQFKPLTENKEYDYFNYESQRYHKLLDIIIEYKKKNYPIQFSLDAYKISRDWIFPLDKIKVSKTELPENHKFPKCYHGDYVCFIDSDGRMYPCCNFWNDYENINIHELGFKKAFEKLHRAGCEACYIYSYIDRNLLINFKIKTLFNYLKIGYLLKK